MPDSCLATVIVATCCDRHDPVARQPELLWQIVGKLCGESELKGRKGRKYQKPDWFIHESPENYMKACRRFINGSAETALQRESSSKLQILPSHTHTSPHACLRRSDLEGVFPVNTHIMCGWSTMEYGCSTAHTAFFILTNYCVVTSSVHTEKRVQRVNSTLIMWLSYWSDFTNLIVSVRQGRETCGVTCSQVLTGRNKLKAFK